MLNKDDQAVDTVAQDRADYAVDYDYKDVDDCYISDVACDYCDDVDCGWRHK